MHTGVNARLLVFSLLFNLGACQTNSRQPVTVTVVDPEWAQPDVSPNPQYQSEQFTRETGIRVVHSPVPETALGQLELSRKLLGDGSPSPDVLGIDVVWPGVLHEYLIDLRPYFAAELSVLDPKLVDSYTVNGKVVAVPYHAQVGVLAYRPDLLREYGYRQPPRTWDELERMAARIQKGERAKGKKEFWGYVWQGAAAEGLTCNALEWQAAEGAGTVIESDKTISVNNPGTIRAWQRAARWVGWISPPGVVAYREPDSMNVWESGRAAFWRTWQWGYRLTHWQKSAIWGKTGFTSVPGGRDGRAGTLGGTGLAVSRSAAHPQEAITFIRFLIRSELPSKNETAENLGSSQPELYDVPRLLKAYAPSDKSTQPPSGVISRPSIVSGTSYEKVTKAYMQAVHSVLTHEKSAPAAAAALEKELVEITGFKAGPPPLGH